MYKAYGKFPRLRDEEFWLVMSFCEEELHELYKEEPKYRHIPSDLWVLKGHNKPILAKHKKEWDQLSPSEKVSAVAAYFFYAVISCFISDCNHRNSHLHSEEYNK